MNREIIYFPGLNGLRFLSALAVIITHVELTQDNLGLDNLWDNLEEELKKWHFDS